MDITSFVENIINDEEKIEKLMRAVKEINREEIIKILLKLPEIEREMIVGEFDIYVDGASSGNPGPSGVGIVVYDGDEAIIRESEYIGSATNNQAEYIACIKALELSENMNARKITIHSDSQLVVKQLNNEYRIKNEKLYEYYNKIRKLERKFLEVEYKYIPRDENKEADMLAKTSLNDKEN